MWKKVKTLLLMVLLANVTVSVLFINASNTVSSNGFPTDRPVIYVDPAENANKTIGEYVTVSVKIYNLTTATIRDPRNPLITQPLGNLYGFEILFTWDPTILEYVNHTVTAPVENFTGGILHNPVYDILEVVNVTAGKFLVAKASLSPAPAFNNPGGHNTIFNMTFRVKAVGGSALSLDKVQLSSIDAKSIAYYRRDYSRHEVFVAGGAGWDPNFEDTRIPQIVPPPMDGYVTTAGTPWASFTYWPDIAVVNKSVVFDASGSYDPDGYIQAYIWNFGDGTERELDVPTVNHTYTSVGVYIVTLRVKDNDGTLSLKVVDEVRVVSKRELVITYVKTMAMVTQNETTLIEFGVNNTGVVAEPVTLSAYINTTSFTDPATAVWQLIWSENHTIPSGFRKMSFNWTVDVSEAYYYVKVNVTVVPHENPLDNTALSPTPLVVALERVHDVAVTDINLYVLGADPLRDLFSPPAIVGEEVRIFISVLANGSVSETFSLSLITVAPNNTVMYNYSWPSVTMIPGTTMAFNVTVKTTKGWSSGVYSIVANVTIAEDDVLPENNVMFKSLRIIQPPNLVINAPEKAIVNTNVSVTAEGSTHVDGEIVSYHWAAYEPGILAIRGRPTYTYVAHNATEVFTFAIEDITGEWDVVLTVTDNYAITYSILRPATEAYRKQCKIVVEGEAFPIELLFYAIAAIIVVIAIVLVYVRLRKPKTE